MKRIVVDLDDTLTLNDSGKSYRDMMPNGAVIDKLKQYKEAGFDIIIYTARNMNTFHNSIGKINAHTLPVILEWLQKHQVPYDEIYVGKPWCGPQGFYIDDRAIRPSEFLSLSLDEIRELIKGGTT